MPILQEGLVLDSSAVIAHLRCKIDIFSRIDPRTRLFLPVIALGELYQGAAKSKRSDENRELVDELAAQTNLLYLANETAEIYAEIAVALEARGEIIPQNDLWIAALALECERPLVTRDAHFRRVDGLTVIEW